MFRNWFAKRSEPVRRGKKPVRRLGSLEQLESRALMAASFGHGLWTIHGDVAGVDAADQFVIDRDATSPGLLRAWLNGSMIDSQEATAVERIRILAGRGDDSVRIDESLGAILNTMMIYGGAGDDLLEGGSGDDLLVGGPGHDALSGNGGADSLRGGSGADRLEGGPGPDDLRGASGKDSVEVGPSDKYVKPASRLARFARPADRDNVIFVTDDPKPDEPPLNGIAIGEVPPGELPGPIVPKPEPIDPGFIVIDDPMPVQPVIVPEVRHIDGGRPVSIDHHQVSPATVEATDGLKRRLIDSTIERWKDRLGTSWEDLWCCTYVWNGSVDWGHVLIDDAAIDLVQAPRMDLFVAAPAVMTFVDVDGGEQLVMAANADVAANDFDLAPRVDPRVAAPAAMNFVNGGGGERLVFTADTAVGRDRVANLNLQVVGNAPSFSQTNTQVQGVDEADIIKTDGNYLYVIAGQELIIVDAWPATEMHVVSRTPLEGTSVSLYLMDDRVMVISRTLSDWRSQQLDNGSQAYILGSVVLDPHGLPTGYAQTKVTVLDVADRTAPQLVQETYLDGRYEESRAIDGRAYLVLRNDLPQLPEPTYQCTKIEDPPADPATASAGWLSSQVHERCTYEDEATYRLRLESTTIDVMPEFTSRVSSEGGVTESSGALVEIGQIYAAYDSTDADLVTVVMVDAAGQTAEPPATMSVLGSQIIVYASAENMYVVASNSTGWSLRSWSAGESSQIFKVNLQPDGVALAAVGDVPGSALNQFSMDEHDGLFRIATSTGRGSWWSENSFSNNLFVLEQQGDQLNVVGGLEGIAPSERIYSARFMGDRAYLVTFKNTDPLFTFDLSDPKHPQLVGELVIPGFSTYLHPYDENHLIALGRQVDWNEPFGLQVALFDVTDMAHPTRTHLYSFGSNLWGEGSEAERDHHAFSFFPEHGVLAIPVSHGEWFGQRSGAPAGLEVFRVSLDQGFSMLGRIEHQTDVRRSLRVEDFLYSVSDNEIKVQPILTPDPAVATVFL